MNSCLLLLPFLSFKSKTPDVLLPYSAGKALIKKSELARILLFIIDTGPPVLPEIAKWDGLGMSMPSTRQTTPKGLFPLIIMSFLESSAP